jgi:hypothetical protein
MLKMSFMQKWTRGLMMAGLAVLTVGGIAAPVQATSIVFDPTGTPGNTFTINSFGFGPGSAVDVGSVPITHVGQTFQIYYQEALTSVSLTSTGASVTPTGLNSTFQITEVGNFTEMVSSISGSTVNFVLAPVQAAGSGIALYENNAFVVNPNAGTGYSVGTVILTASFSGAAANEQANYTDTTLNGTKPGTPPLNPTGSAYSGITTDNGTGSTTLVANVIATNPNFFISPLPLITTNFSSNLTNPFADIPAPPQFLSTLVTGVGLNVTTGPTIAPSVGSNNGTSGPDFLQEISGATQAFAVPEPASITMSLTAIGIGTIFGLRVNRRRQRTASV